MKKNWKKYKIKNIFNITRGNVLSTKELMEYNDNLYPVYSSQTKNNGLLGYYDKFLFENSITWTTDGANAGDVHYRDNKFYCTNVCGVLTEKTMKPNLCIALAIGNLAKRYVSYVGNPKLMNNVMSEIEISLPSVEEQEKIGSFFKELDELIDLYADYKSLMIDKIKYTMSNVKPSTDKKCKVSELYDITRGYYIPKDSLSMHGAYPVYSSQTKNKGIMGYSSKYLFEDCMIWSTDGYAGEVRYVPGKFNCTNVCGVMINNEGYCNSFVAYYLNKLFKKYVSNSGIPKLMNNVVQNIPIELPTLDEQYELSNFIDEAAKLIDFIDELMIGLIRKKKYYLNKIFN